MNRARYRIILSEDPDEAGVYTLNDGKACKYRSFAFVGILKSVLFKTEQMTSSQFGKMSVYELCHRRLGHRSNRYIRDTILQDWNASCSDMHQKFEPDMKCPSRLHDGKEYEAEGPDTGTTSPSEQGLIIFSTHIDDGCNYAVGFADCDSGYRWIMGI